MIDIRALIWFPLPRSLAARLTDVPETGELAVFYRAARVLDRCALARLAARLPDAESRRRLAVDGPSGTQRQQHCIYLSAASATEALDLMRAIMALDFGASGCALAVGAEHKELAALVATSPLAGRIAWE